MFKMNKLITPVKVEIIFIHKTKHFKIFILRWLKGIKAFLKCAVKLFFKNFYNVCSV
jgi:hypothetical protein